MDSTEVIEVIQANGVKHHYLAVKPNFYLLEIRGKTKKRKINKILICKYLFYRFYFLHNYIIENVMIVKKYYI